MKTFWKLRNVLSVIVLSHFTWQSSAASFEAPFPFLLNSSNETKSRSSHEPEIQSQIDSAIIDIMATRVGLGICQYILNADPVAIEHHLGVSRGAAQQVALNCKFAQPNVEWVEPTPVDQIEKLSIGGPQKRHYVFVVNGDSIPFDSWTEPYSNTTVFVIHSKRDKPINRQRLIQLLAHETAVYFDSKAQLGHSDAQYLPQIRALEIKSTSGPGAPQLSIMNPLIAHTLTFIRALKVEQAIVTDLIGDGKMSWPEEYSDRLISNLLSGSCAKNCLAKTVQDMREIYFPFTLPLVAFSPTYRAQKRQAIQSLSIENHAKWLSLNRALDEFPHHYIESLGSLTSKPFLEMIQSFARPSDDPAARYVEDAFRTYLWPEDWDLVRDAIVISRNGSVMSLLEFMKAPLLSGYNISFTNGPRVRIRAGDTL